MQANRMLKRKPHSKNPATPHGDFQTGRVISLASAHGIHDAYSSFLAPLLPVLIERLSILKVEAGAFLVFQQFPSIMQPVIGHLADRMSLKRLVLLAPAITASAMSLLAVCKSYWAAAVLLVISGLASATLHAVSPAIISRFSGRMLGRGMSFWMISGEIGVMAGPILIATTISVFSISAAPWLMAGGIAASFLLAYWLRDVEFFSCEYKPKTLQGSGKKLLRVFLPLAGILIARALLMSAVLAYMPVYLTEKGISLWLAGASITLLQASGIVGIFLSSHIKDRIEVRWIFLGSLFGSSLTLFLLLKSEGIMLIILMILLGSISLSLVPIGMAVMQENFPNNRSFANGLYMSALFVSESGAGVLMGRLADLFGMPSAFLWSVWACLLGIPFIFFLPQPARKATGSS